MAPPPHVAPPSGKFGSSFHTPYETHPTQPEKVKQGDILHLNQFLEVLENVNQGSSLVVRNLHNGETFQINGKDLIQTTSWTKYPLREEKTNRTQLHNRLVETSGTLFRAKFKKKITQDNVLDALSAQLGDKSFAHLSKKEKNAIARSLLNAGEEREIVGRLMSPILSEGGRFVVEDLEVLRKNHKEKTECTTKREVDPRTLEYVVSGGVKYKVN
uniref:Uncharacterized protein n=1 Tax=Palpitomonas bilix TaxID=652834 RepID=A0A7S3D1H0_9EUKA|mmetsp:Transcript_18173/g.45385  ORF Transcript_18173/g.45385 Transcript_18173/m.45385 type:complete len:215 (+) Transcript_18173:2223-2867(+)